MISLLSSIGSGLSTAFEFLTKNTLIGKISTFGIFITVVSAAVDFLQSLIAPYMPSGGIFAVAAYFGVLDGLTIFIKILIAGWGAKQILAFVRST